MSKDKSKKVQHIQEIRRSNAAGPHRDSRTKRLANKLRKNIQDQES